MYQVDDKRRHKRPGVDRALIHLSDSSADSIPIKVSADRPPGRKPTGQFRVTFRSARRETLLHETPFSPPLEKPARDALFDSF